MVISIGKHHEKNKKQETRNKKQGTTNRKQEKTKNNNLRQALSYIYQGILYA